MKPTFALATLLLPVALSGCAALAAASLATEYDDLDAQYGSLAATTTLPAGRATYDGVATLGASVSSTSSAGTALIGDASLTANFDTGSFSGEVTDWVGAAVDDVDAAQNDPASIISELKKASGTISIDGTFAAAAPFSSDLSGSVTLGGTTYTVGGEAETTFKGTGAEAVTVVGSTDDDMTVTVDGAAWVGDFDLIAAQPE